MRFQISTNSLGSLGAGAHTYDFSIGPSAVNISKIIVTSSNAACTWKLEIFKRDTKLAGDEQYSTQNITASAFYDPSDVNGGQALEGFVIPYEDLDGSGELHVTLTNNATSTFSISIIYEEVVVTDSSGIVLVRSGKIAFIDQDGTSSMLRCVGNDLYVRKSDDSAYGSLFAKYLTAVDGKIYLGPATSSYPMFIISGAQIAAYLGNESGYANFYANTILATSGTVHFGAGLGTDILVYRSLGVLYFRLGDNSSDAPVNVSHVIATGGVYYFGAIDASHSMWAASSTTIKARLGNDSAYTHVDALDYYAAGTKVVGARDTGWGAMTGTPDKATAFATSSVTLAQLAGRVMSLQAALTTHGLLGT